MNLCILFGEINSNIDFEFLYKSKKISITIFTMKLTNNCIIEGRAYDDLADFIYSKFNKGDKILALGALEGNYILIDEIIKINI